jgi:hypothetical protein
MFWHLTLILSSPLHLVFALLFSNDRARLVVDLHQQVLVLQQQLGKQPSSAQGEPLALVPCRLVLGR